MSAERDTAIIVRAWPGQPTPAELERQAADGEVPRRDYVEVARALDADVIDATYMSTRASRLARAAARRGGMEAGQVVEVFGRRRYRNVLAWTGGGSGIKLATLLKLARSRRDVVEISTRITSPRRAAAIARLGVHSHIKAFIFWSSVQLEHAIGLGVPRDKARHVLHHVDERYWQARDDRGNGALVVSVGSEARDFPTLFEAVRGTDVATEIAVGSMVGVRPTADAMPERMRPLDLGHAPPNVEVRIGLEPDGLRDLYARARVVVVPLLDVDFDAGVTAILEAMAMGCAVITTSTRGQVDVVVHGETGLYVPPDDPAALRQAIESLAADPERARRMGQAGRAVVERNHAFDRVMAMIADTVRGS